MSLNDIVNLQIAAGTKVPTRLGFGTPLLMAYHSVTPNRIEVVKSPKSVTDLGFATTSPVYRMALKAFSQNPRPSQLLIGKRTRAYTQTVRILPKNATEGYTYDFDVIDASGVKTAISYVVVNGDTVAAICTALAALITPVNGCTATAAATYVEIEADTGTLVNLKRLPPISAMEVSDVTTDPGIADDLAEIEALDATTWYAVALDSNSRAEIESAAAFMEARRKLLAFNTTDSDVAKAGSGDIASTLKSAAYGRTLPLFSATELLSYSALAWLGAMLPLDPGSATWAFKTLATVTADTLTDGQLTQLAAKNVSSYTNVGGINITYQGQSPAGEFIDVTQFCDWLHARTQERVFGTMANAKKVPYTDTGVDLLRNDILAVLKEGIKIGGLSPDPAPVVTAPKVADVDPAVRASRRLPNVEFSAKLAGAIHALDISGVVSV